MSDQEGARPSETGSRASHEAAGASSPSGFDPAREWPEIEYDGNGYPEDEDFLDFADLPFDFRRAAVWMLSELPRAAEHMPCSCEVESGYTVGDNPCQHIRFSTCGWSGAESLLALIERRVDLSYFMLSWRRGGHYVFEIPNRYIAIAAGSGTAKTPQAVECEASQSGHRPTPTPSPKEE